MRGLGWCLVVAMSVGRTTPADSVLWGSGDEKRDGELVVDTLEGRLDLVQVTMAALQERIDELEGELAAARAGNESLAGRLDGTGTREPRVAALEAIEAGPRLDGLGSVGAGKRLEAVGAGERLDALEAVDADARLDAVESVSAGPCLDAVELVGAGPRLDALEALTPGPRLDAADGALVLLGDAIGAATSQSDAAALAVDALAADVATNGADVAAVGVDLSALTGALGDVVADIADRVVDLQVLDDSTVYRIQMHTTFDIPGDFPGLLEAFEALDRYRIDHDASVTLLLAPGTHTLADEVTVRHPDGDRILIVGDIADPSQVVRSFPTNTDGFDVGIGSRLGPVTGVTVDGNGSTGMGFRV